MSKENGGTAFPMQDPQAIHAYAQAKTEAANSADVNERDQIYLAARAEAVGGMTLRDYFAAQALAGLCAHAVGPAKGRLETSAEAHARAAYAYADEMLAERAK